ncbi:MAG: ABC transporter ATP-binding protein, partial [Paludibacteraceae bacterium]|nr:ABC transporter ATP-binding protein [Paludibacteraceae bacterium]
MRILFGLTEAHVQRIDLSAVNGLQETIAALRTNLYCLLNDQIAVHGAGVVLLWLGLFLIGMTGLKCLTAWLANYFMVPIQTGVLRDLRQQLYDKVLS